MSPSVNSEWNAENTTLPPDNSIPTYGDFPVYPTSDVPDTSSFHPMVVPLSGPTAMRIPLLPLKKEIALCRKSR